MHDKILYVFMLAEETDIKARKIMLAAGSLSVALLCLVSGGHANKTVAATAKACKYRLEIHCYDWVFSACVDVY